MAYIWPMYSLCKLTHSYGYGLCVYIYVHNYTYTCIYIYTHNYTYTCVYIYICALCNGYTYIYSHAICLFRYIGCVRLWNHNRIVWHIRIAPPRLLRSVQHLHNQLWGTLPCRWPQRACDGNPLGEVFVGTLALKGRNPGKTMNRKPLVLFPMNLSRVSSTKMCSKPILRW